MRRNEFRVRGAAAPLEPRPAPSVDVSPPAARRPAPSRCAVVMPSRTCLALRLSGSDASGCSLTASRKSRTWSTGTSSAGRSGSVTASSSGLGTSVRCHRCTSWVASNCSIRSSGSSRQARPGEHVQEGKTCLVGRSLPQGLWAKRLNVQSGRRPKDSVAELFRRATIGTFVGRKEDRLRGLLPPASKVRDTRCDRTVSQMLLQVNATAAAICGVAEEVPAPLSRTSWPQPQRAQGILGVNAASAVAIAAGGPQFPCIVPNFNP